MISLLKGKVEFLDRPYLVLDVFGVGYRVLVSSGIFEKSKIGQSLKLFTFTYVREDALELFGFADLSDLKLFEQLISVSGIGPKTALSIFSFGNRESIIGAVIKADVDFFTSVPRLGRKNAQKIIIELKSKVGSLEELDLSGDGFSKNNEVIMVLKGFGFSAKEAQEAIKNIDKKIESVEQKIRLALKYLGK